MTDSPEFYERQAALAEAEAETTTLPNIRDRALATAQRWRELAEHARHMQGHRERAFMFRQARDEGR